MVIIKELVRISGHLLAIDPGSKKCGLAVVTNEGQVLKKMVVPIERLNEIVSALEQEFSLTMILVGDRTNSKYIRECLTMFQLPIVVVDEDQSTVEGRYRYLKENTRGLARLIPIGLRIPKSPFDDYVAVVLAERYLKNNSLLAEGK
jgi:RNase H-fold protein (predicted Holliday junction resolvase)